MLPPLQGYRILACENGLAGPLCSRLLADLGADVVKIERPGAGDVTRGWDTGAAGLATGFVWVNRGKRSVALDLTSAPARSALDRLIERSDVFLQNFAPGWAERMGLDERSVRRLRPDVVYTEITGYDTLEGRAEHRPSSRPSSRRCSPAGRPRSGSSGSSGRGSRAASCGTSAR